MGKDRNVWSILCLKQSLNEPLQPTGFFAVLPDDTLVVAAPLGLNDLVLEMFKVMWLVAVLAVANNDPWRLLEEGVHLLKWSTSSLGQNSPEEERVGQVADDEQNVIFPANIVHGNRSNLTLRKLLAKVRSRSRSYPQSRC